MSDIRNLIQRAWEIAALADEATPGPWEVKLTNGFDIKEYTSNNGVYFENGCLYTTQPDPDADFMAMAPTMAQLIRQLADALEQAYAWMKDLRLDPEEEEE